MNDRGRVANKLVPLGNYKVDYRTEKIYRDSYIFDNMKDFKTLSENTSILLNLELSS